MKLLVNIDFPIETSHIPVEADGVGLLRSELFYAFEGGVPSVDAEASWYVEAGRHTQGRPLTVRLLDPSGDKALPFLDERPEPNPALGERGIRLLLRRRDLLLNQLRACVVANAEVGNVRVLIPMVTLGDEVQAVQQNLDEVMRWAGVRARLRPEVGVMIETPTAAFGLKSWPAVDFVSIGSNDLLQLATGRDRENPTVSCSVSVTERGTRSFFEAVVRELRGVGVPISICGELASELDSVPWLGGLGVDALSVSLPRFRDVRACLSPTTIHQAPPEPSWCR